jgi:hypothetical protein
MVALPALLLAVLGIAAVARAELTVSGNMFINFDGGITPDALPRHERAPISVWMVGKVRTLKGNELPSLQQITLSLNRNGRLETRGLPICRIGQVEAASSEQAMKACGDALVGTGQYRARLKYRDQAPTPSFGRILAFNARLHGKEAILGQVYASSPARSTDVIVFRISRTSGRFGTVLRGEVPPGLSRWGYLKRISLRLHREYTFKGRRMSYLSAPCAAPGELRQASFPFVYAAMAFDDGRELSATLTRTCRVKGP